MMYDFTALCADNLPYNKPRYLMGVGTPWNILECISLGIDMFDCVMPTRNGRNGMLFTTQGVINIKNKKWATDFSPIDEGLSKYNQSILYESISPSSFCCRRIFSVGTCQHSKSGFLSLARWRRLVSKSSTVLCKLEG